MELLYILKNAFGFVFKVVPMLLKYLDKKIFPFDSEKLILTDHRQLLDKFSSSFSIFFSIQNYSFTKLELLSVESGVTGSNGLFFKAEKNVYQVIENRSVFKFDDRIPLSSNQLLKLQELIQNNQRVTISFTIKAKVREEYQKLEVVISTVIVD